MTTGREDANFTLERFAASFASADVLLLAVLLVAPKYGALVSALGGGLLACGGGDRRAGRTALQAGQAVRCSRCSTGRLLRDRARGAKGTGGTQRTALSSALPVVWW